MADTVFVELALKVGLTVWLKLLLGLAVLDEEILTLLVRREQRVAVAETVDVRLTVIDFVLVGDPVDVLDPAIVRVCVILTNGVFVPTGESVEVGLALELEELVLEAVGDFDAVILRVVLTVAVPVLELVTVDVVVRVYTGVIVPLAVLVIVDEPEDVLD